MSFCASVPPVLFPEIVCDPASSLNNVYMYNILDIIYIQAFQFRKHDFDLWVGGRGDGLNMYQQL